MLDVTLIRQQPEQFRETRTTVERLRGERRRISAEIAAHRRAGTEAHDLQVHDLQVHDLQAHDLQVTATALADQVAQAETELTRLTREHQQFLDALPNLPDADVLAGGKENNAVVRTV